MSALRWFLTFTAVGSFATAGYAATIQWDGGGDGTNWNQALNWVGDVAPSATNDVVIDVPGTNITITKQIMLTRLRICEPMNQSVSSPSPLKYPKGILAQSPGLARHEPTLGYPARKYQQPQRAIISVRTSRFFGSSAQ